MNRSKISWCDATLNIMPFCSTGCAYCYRQRIMQRSSCPDCRNNRPHFHQERLAKLRSKPFGNGICFLNSMGDLFDLAANKQWHAQLWPAVAASSWQIIVLTKQPYAVGLDRFPWAHSKGKDWPDNLWLGISVENQRNLETLAPLLNELVRPGRLILSAEPLLGPLNLTKWLGFFRWVIIGGLSGSWLPQGWTDPVSLSQAQAKWTRDIAQQIHHHNRKAIYPVALWVKDDQIRLPHPAPTTQLRPPEMLGQPVPNIQAELFE
jgi:protein gp37